jgi:hypothetical protein
VRNLILAHRDTGEMGNATDSGSVDGHGILVNLPVRL